MAGAVLGAVLLLHLPEWFRFLERGYLVIYGAALLLTVVLAPDGLTGLLHRLTARLYGGKPCSPVEAREPPPPALLEGLAVEGLRKSFGGVRAVDRVSLDLRPGTITGLIGPNGSGKSTVINLLSGLERPDAGRVRLGGQDVTGARADRLARAGLARSFQAALLPTGAGVLEAVAAARLAFDPDAATAEAHARWALDRLGVGDLAGQSCDGLPAALRRRVELARALVRRPSVLLLDEPAAGLTDGEKAELAVLLRDLAGEGMAILLVEHDMGFLLPLAGRVLCLDRGRVIYDGPAGGVRRDLAVATAYLGRAGSA